MKQPSYRHAIERIALEDEPTDLNPESIRGLASVVIIATIFDVTEEKVAADVAKYRLKEIS